MKRFKEIRPASRVSSVAVALLVILWSGMAAAQEAFVTGTVTNESGEPVVGAVVRVVDSSLATLTSSEGGYRLGPIAPGAYVLEATALGYEPSTREVRVAAGASATVRFQLALRPVALAGVSISVLRPDMRPEDRLEQREVRQANPRDVGEALRVLPGVDAVRRGPLGLDPVVRGLRETEVGVYLDGTRQFPAGPARMDSPLTHLDPSTIETVDVVKGPYALTWGAGNMSAIRVRTQPIPPPVPGTLHGRALAGYDANLGASEFAASAFGGNGPTAYALHGAWREGNDYEAGGGTEIPGDFLSREVRGKIGYRLAPGSWVRVSGGYQQQDDLDYPGRLLDAEYFRARNFAAEWSVERPTGTLRSLEAQAYVNGVDHGMNNDQKPTAQPMPGRTPPFALDVQVDSEVDVLGGRLATVLDPGAGLELEVGGDVYRANRFALRTIARRDNGMVMFEDLMWPDATITDAGVFARAERAFGPVTLSGTGRLDVVRARADTASQFFRDNVSTDLDADETNVSAAVVASVQPAPAWTLSVGAGSVVRTADATERYSDRIPASKAQMSAEFVGSPDLEPERSTQADLWIEAAYPRLSLSFNAFARRITNYITLDPTDLPKRLPLSPETVYQYVNGEADFWGGEVTAAYAVIDPLTIGAAATYLHGTDTYRDEPALGVSPLRASVTARWEPAESGYYLESSVHAVAEQDRVATSRGELPSDGYTTVDAEAGVRVRDGMLIRFGVKNLFDTEYSNHLNAKNPFTGMQIPEPGRVLFARVSYSF